MVHAVVPRIDATRQARPQLVTILAPPGHLPMRIRPAVSVTDEMLFELCSVNRDLRIERTAEGELVIMTPTGGETGRRNFELIVLFGAWVKQDGTGVGFDSSTGFLLPNGAERSPDLAWVRRSRWDELSADDRRRFVPLCPDFVVELRSPSDDLADLGAKMDEYIACGARLAWLIDPEEGRVLVYRPGADRECLIAPREICGDPELPGLVLDLSRVL